MNLLKRRLFILFFIFSSSVFASSYPLYFNTLSHAGLGDRSALGCVQDKDGYLWFLESNGVYRYDGHSFRSYDFAHLHPMGWLTKCYNILYTRSNDLYVTTSGGVMRYCKQKNDFVCVYNRAYRTLYEDIEGQLWFGGTDIVRWNPKTGETTPLQSGEQEVVGQLYTCPQTKNVYVISNNLVLIYHCVSSSVRQASVLPLPSSIKRVVAMQQVEDKLYMLTEKDGLWQMDTTFEQILTLGDNVTARKLAYRDGCVYIGSMQGLFVYNLITTDLQHYQQTDQEGSLSNNSIQSIFFDKENNLWLGTYAGGICMASSQPRNHFHPLRMRDMGSLNAMISAVLPTRDGLWIGTEGDGLYRYQEGKGLTAHFTHNQTPQDIGANNIKALYEDGNNLWIGMYLGGLSCLNTKTHIVRRYTPDKRILSDQVFAFCARKDGLWVVYQSVSEMLTKFSFDGSASEHYTIPSPVVESVVKGGYHSPVSSRLYRILSVGDTLWLGTTTSLHTFAVSGQYGYSVTPEHPVLMTCFVYDAQRQRLWIGTKSDGLIYYDLVSRQFEYVHQLEGHAIRTIVLYDGVLWMGFDDGVYSYHPQTGAIHYYNQYDGIEGAIVSSAVDTIHHRIYWAGLGVIYYLDMDGISYNNRVPEVLVSDIRVNGHSIPLSDKLVLSSKENNLAIDLAATNFVQSDKNRYRFRYTPLSWMGVARSQLSWTEVDAQHRTLHFMQMPAGRYRLEVMASNNDGVWGETKTLFIRIQPIFWLSVWAWMIYVLIGGLIIAYFIFSSLRHRRLQNELYQAQIREQEQEKAGRAKVRFFTDVSKELKTPLLQLQAMVDVRHVPYVQEMLDIMDKYADRYCIDVGRDYNKQQTEQNLDKLTRLIDERMDRHIDIDLLAREMGMSRRKLFDFVKNNTGKSIIEYIRSYRLSTAAKLLFETNLTILEVMDKVGIESQSYFVKSFKKEFGDTPADFVAKMSKNNA